MSIYYIDYENVHNAGLHGVDALSANDVVRIFYKDNDTMQLPQVKALLESAATIRFDRVRRSTPNALDFQLLAELFCIADVSQQYYIISRDKGYDSAIDVARSHNIFLQRKEAIDARDFIRMNRPQEEPAAAAGTVEEELLAAGDILEEVIEETAELFGDEVFEEESAPAEPSEEESEELPFHEEAAEETRTVAAEEAARPEEPSPEAVPPEEEPRVVSAKEEPVVVTAKEEPVVAAKAAAPAESAAPAETEQPAVPVEETASGAKEGEQPQEARTARQSRNSRNRRGRKSDTPKNAEQGKTEPVKVEQTPAELPAVPVVETAKEESLPEAPAEKPAGEENESAEQPKNTRTRNASRQGKRRGTGHSAEKASEQEKTAENKSVPALEEPKTAPAAAEISDGKKIEGVVLHSGIQNVSAKQYDLIAEAVRNSNNKNRFYQYFVKKLGAEKGLELYNSVKSHYLKFVDALK